MNDFDKLVRQWLDEPNLNPVEKVLLYKLARHIQRGDRRPTVEQLSMEVRCSQWLCREGIRALIKLGMLFRRNRRREGTPTC